MSMDYWSVVGYAIQIDGDMFNPLFLNEIGLDGEHACSGDLSDVMRHLNQNTPLTWAVDCEDNFYIIYRPNAYFEMLPAEKSFESVNDVADAMYELLKPALKTEEENASCSKQAFRDNIDFINTYGCG